MNNTNKDFSSESLYLDQLKFEEKDRHTWLTFFIDHFRVTGLIIAGLLALGIYSFNALPLESSPEVKIPFGIIVSGLPGASPSDIEELIVKKIEARVVNLSGVKQVSSNALNSIGTVSVEFRADEDIKESIRKLRDAVSTIKSELPEGAIDPTVSEVSFDNQPIWTIVVTGPYDSFNLRNFAKKVQTTLEKLPQVNKVQMSGGDIYEARVSVDPVKLANYKLSIDQLNGAIKASNFSLPLGTLSVSQFEYTVSADAKISTVKSLRDLPIAVINGSTIRLSDVADVIEIARERTSYSQFSKEGQAPQTSVTLNITKKAGGSIIDLIDEGKRQIEIIKANEIPKNVLIETTLDVSQLIRRDFDQLKHDGFLTIILVSTIIFLFVGLKEAFVAGLAVPLVFCATFALMLKFGITLNFLSIFSLILSLGLLVDDAIVVVQATKQYLKTGKFTPEEAVLLVFHDFKILLTTTTLTTIWAFIPLLLATGIIGEFIRSIPITVSVTLAASYVIAIIINHPMAIILERFRITRFTFKIFVALAALMMLIGILNIETSFILGVSLIAFGGVSLFAFIIWYRRGLKASLIENERLMIEELADDEKIKAKIQHHYQDESTSRSIWIRLITGVIKIDHILHRYGEMLYSLLESTKKSRALLIGSGLLFVIATALPISGLLKSEFLPPNDSEYLYVNIEGAKGLVLEKTRLVVNQISPILQKEPAIKSFSLVIGAEGVNTQGDASGGSDIIAGGLSNRAQFAINLQPYNERPVSPAVGEREKSYVFSARLRELLKPINGAKVTVVEVAGGPPAGSDFEARFSGEDLTKLQQIVNEYKKILSDIPGTENEKISVTPSAGDFTLRFDHQKMSERGIVAAQVMAALRLAQSGSSVSTIDIPGEDDLSVRTEFNTNAYTSVDDLLSMPLTSNRGQTFLLRDIATADLKPSVTSIQRIDEKRVIVLSSSVVKPYLPASVLTEFQLKLASKPLPSGYTVTFGGQNDTNTESIFSILRAMVVAMLLIIGTLVIQFNSYRKAVLVLATIPLAMSGVFIGFTVTGFTLSFPALIGVLALFGVVVKNAIIMVDKINLNLEVGIPYADAIVDAAKSRLEAILLTSMCTMIGMLPITISNEVWRGLGLALIFGLISSTFLTLFVIPVLFNIVMGKSWEKQKEIKKLRAQSEAKSQ